MSRIDGMHGLACGEARCRTLKLCQTSSRNGMQKKELMKPRGAVQQTLENLRTMAHEDSEMGWKRVNSKIVERSWLLYRLCGRSLRLLRPFSTLA